MMILVLCMEEADLGVFSEMSVFAVAEIRGMRF